MGYVRLEGDRIIIELKDSIDYETGCKILDEATPLITPDVIRIDVHCGNLEHINEDGMHALRHIKWEAKADMVLHNVAKHIKDTFILTMMDRYFEFREER